jgi:Uma2 family endonuclease
VAFWLGSYRANTAGVEVLADATTELDDLGEPQPDASLRILPEYGGQSRDEGKYIAGSPELVVEVADSSRKVDLGDKLADYERTGTLEYIVAALDPAEVFYFVRQGNRLVRITPDPDGLYRSRCFPGLWLDPRALLEDDPAALLAALECGMVTPEHRAFLARLAERRE